MSAAIYNAIEQLLTTDQSQGSLYQQVAGRIHANQLPNDSDYPAIRYATIADPLTMRFAADGRDVDVQFDVYGRRNQWDLVDEINELLRAALHRARLEIAGFQGGQVRALDYGAHVAEADVARVMSRYRIWANQ